MKLCDWTWRDSFQGFVNAALHRHALQDVSHLTLPACQPWCMHVCDIVFVYASVCVWTFLSFWAKVFPSKLSFIYLLPPLLFFHCMSAFPYLSLAQAVSVCVCLPAAQANYLYQSRSPSTTCGMTFVSQSFLFTSTAFLWLPPLNSTKSLKEL